MEKVNSYLTFRIGDEYYAASVKYVHNIIEHTSITKVPDMPESVLGVINLRGQVLPVIDTRVKFRLENTDITTNTCILVLEVEIENKQVFTGALVDAVAEVIEIRTDEIKDPPSLGSHVVNDFITGVYHDGEKFTMILDMNQIFAFSASLKIKLPAGTPEIA